MHLGLSIENSLIAAAIVTNGGILFGKTAALSQKWYALSFN